jgi:hypothetical protein
MNPPTSATCVHGGASERRQERLVVGQARITGVFHKVSAKHLSLYLDEFSFRFKQS